MNAERQNIARHSRQILVPKLRAMDFTSIIWEAADDCWFAVEIDAAPWQLCYAKIIMRGYAK